MASLLDAALRVFARRGYRAARIDDVADEAGVTKGAIYHYFDTKGEATGAYDAPATSYVVVFNKAGKVVYTGLGGKQDLEAAIKKAL